METFIDMLTSIAAQGDVYRALSMAREHEHTDPLRYHLGSSAAYAAAGQADACLEHARRAHQRAPQNPLVLQQCAVAHTLAQDHERAEEYARQALARDNSARSRRGLANILLRRGQIDQARELYAELLATEPDDVQARNGLGLVCLRSGDHAAALEHFADAYVAAPDHPGALRNVLNMYAEAGWAIGAVALSRITRSGKHRDEVNVALDMMNLMLSQQIAPDFPGKDRIAETPQTITGLVECSASLSSAVQLHAARMLFDSEHLDAAQAIVERLRSQTESMSAADRGNWHYVAGLVAESAGKTDAALAHYTASVEVDPQRWDGCCNAVTILLERGDPEALAEAERLLGLVPDDLKLFRHQLLFNEAMFFRRAGRTDEAIGHCKLIVEVTGGQGPMAELAQGALRELQGMDSH